MLTNKARFKRRTQRVRSRIKKESSLPRLSVFKSNRHLQVQVIDDLKSITVSGVSTLQKEFSKLKNKANIEAAKLIGSSIGKAAVKKGVKKVVFDKGGYRYHGVVKAIADSAREAGLEI